MGVVDFTFYLFSLTTVLAGLFVVVARNPVHSVLWLILAFQIGRASCRERV